MSRGSASCSSCKTTVFNVDIFALERGETPEGATPQAVVAPLGLTSFRVAPGELLTADVVIQNKGIAHSHVPEQRDMYESWVDFTVKDANGKVLSESGFIQPNGDLDQRVHSFTNRLINVKGTRNYLHEVWNNRVVAYNNTIQSGRSQIVRYAFHMPASGGPVTHHGDGEVSPLRPALCRLRDEQALRAAGGGYGVADAGRSRSATTLR